jgi:two-component system, cell cycle response regulator DivK
MNASSRIKVLVVEDNMLNLELVTDLLEATGHLVCQARTAEEGLRLAQTASPDVILMDLSLPGMDGLAATRALRANRATAHLPIIALTANAMKGDEENALKAGCNGYLAKPIDTRTFIARVADLIEAAKPQGPSTQLKGDDCAN